MSNNKISYFTHWIKVNDDEYQIDPRFGEDNYVNSLDFFRGNKNKFVEPFITYFQIDDRDQPYSLNFVKYDNKELFHARVDYLDDFTGLDDGSDEYFSFIRDLDEGILDMDLLLNNEFINWKKII